MSSAPFSGMYHSECIALMIKCSLYSFILFYSRKFLEETSEHVQVDEIDIHHYNTRFVYMNLALDTLLTLAYFALHLMEEPC